jgi:DNA-binding response OmpR family regulator
MSSLRPASATAFVTSGYCARPSAPESAAAATPSHILLADRDLSAQAPIAEYIARTYPSITIVKASDGDEASKALEEHPVGIALIDRCLPGLDGADFVRELKKRATLFGLLSDRLVPRWARVAQAIGAYDVLLKPLRAAQVDNFLAAWNRTCQPANVLLVESSQKTLDVVARLLRQSSFKLNLDFSGTARETLKALVPEFYDIAFVNLALADGSGVETALRVIARSPGTRIITFGNHDRFTAATLKSLGVAAHLPVPFEPHALELALHDLFGLWRPYLLQAIDQAEKSDQTGLNDLRRVSA